MWVVPARDHGPDRIYERRKDALLALNMVRLGATAGPLERLAAAASTVHLTLDDRRYEPVGSWAEETARVVGTVCRNVRTRVHLFPPILDGPTSERGRRGTIGPTVVGDIPALALRMLVGLANDTHRPRIPDGRARTISRQTMT